MRYWLMMFRPETYDDVRAHGTIGVRTSARNTLKQLSEGDRFVAYLSRVQKLDGLGTVAGEPFVDDTPIFSGDKRYRHRCHVSFEGSGFDKAVGDTLWFLSTLPNPMKTTPTNYAFVKGGILEIAAQDYELLVRVMKGEQEPPTLGWKSE